MTVNVKGLCPKCNGNLSATFNSGIVDLLGDMSSPQNCPHCGVLLDVNVTVKKTYTMNPKEHVEVIKSK